MKNYRHFYELSSWIKRSRILSTIFIWIRWMGVNDDCQPNHVIGHFFCFCFFVSGCDCVINIYLKSAVMMNHAKNIYITIWKVFSKRSNIGNDCACGYFVNSVNQLLRLLFLRIQFCRHLKNVVQFVFFFFSVLFEEKHMKNCDRVVYSWTH